MDITEALEVLDGKFATQEKVSKGFEKIGESLKERDGDFKRLQDDLVDIRKSLRKFNRVILQQSFADGSYAGFWCSEEEAKGFGEFVRDALNGRGKALGESYDGAPVVPIDFSSRIIDKIGAYGKFRSNATILPMSSDQILVPKLTTDLTIYCPGEGSEITESDIAFGQVALNPKKWAALTRISTELEEDAIVALGEIIGMSVARSLAKKEDLVGFLGDGTSTYFGTRGITGALRAVDSTISNIEGLVVASGNAYSEITLSDFQEVVGILPTDADENAKWYMSRKFYYNVVWPLAETAGVANIFEILSDRKSRYFLGYPVEFVSCMPATEANSQICAILGDLKMGSYLGQRKQLTIDRSEHVFFKYAQVALRAMERIDFNVFGVGDTNDAGPIVGLITAAS